MRIFLANPRGFCAGVDMAIRCLEIVVDQLPGPIYVYHEIVHNQSVVRHFEDRGVIFVDDVVEVPEAATLVFSAHGVSPAIRAQAKERRLRTIDATCPLVAKVHAETIRFAKRGYQIVLIGHAGHDEIVGTIGEAPERVHLVQHERDVEQLTFSNEDRLAYLTQTTLSVAETDRIVSRLKERFPRIEGPSTDDICYATQNRQSAIRALAAEANLVLVVGSQNSSNSRRLCEVAVEHGSRAQLIDGPAQLREEWFHEHDTVAISAGASAPEAAVQDVIHWLENRYPVEIETRGNDEQQRVFPLPVELNSLNLPL